LDSPNEESTNDSPVPNRKFHGIGRLVSAANGFEIIEVANGAITGACTFKFETADGGLRVAPAPLGNRAIVRERNGDWALLNTENGSEIHREDGHADLLDYVYVAFSRDGEAFAVSTKSGGCEVRATETGAKRYSLSGHKAALRGVEFVASKPLIITISDDWTGRLWAAGRLRNDIEVMNEQPSSFFGLATLWLQFALTEQLICLMVARAQRLCFPTANSR
jgi:hypothetical protein